MRSRLRAEGWLWVLLLVAPVLLASGLPRVGTGYGPLLFSLGLALLFFSLPRFNAFKHALIDMERALGSGREEDAWRHLAKVRRRALPCAALPAWLGALGMPAGLEPVAAYLLLTASLVLLLLYRIPGQLG
ncbi:hypothetical protein [Stutzerimonas kirkiae]|uniref:MFS transporter n=1 Tax=Stutzerimonas kirkiae TaxID=2211392 RepID=A0A4Q9R570_9GAMM|nr:hypothetical protein [Stutzerimonas kirkiae]TBU94577.1 hypothetical protein DNJ96_13155 [Stutzerimonas kirkiae]TBV00738.1 hypothetical protein DNJ95_14070 [Stutzerimonas kirkiae]TBV04335.1 hypothetical protein DNK08_17070 [Stutzerimonas kirkiae]TBV12733.1 hypothetical protein DNK01_13675 [Stutzerimonas kirkiae]